MASSIGQRLGQVISHSGKSVNQFAAELGERPDKYYNVIRGRSNPSWEMIENVIRICPEVDGNWLLKGEGEIVKATEAVPAALPQPGHAEPAADQPAESREELLRQIIADKQKLILALEKQVALLEKWP
jgi:hypothetical protein